MKKSLPVLITLLATLAAFTLPKASASNAERYNPPKTKQTTLGKYLTSTKAYELLQKDGSLLFIDVRDSVEIGLTGHPANIDAVVPIQIQTTQYNTTFHEFEHSNNVHFLTEMEDVLKLNDKTKNDMIIITCGSGVRSAMAVNKLAKAGYTNVWHISDGYKGDNKPGLNTKNAWQLAGLPWSKELVYGSHWRLIITPE